MTSTVQHPVLEPLYDPFAALPVEGFGWNYDRLRSEAPVHWDPVLQLWVLSRSDDVRAVLRDESFQPISLSESIALIGRKAGRDYSSLIQAADAVLFFQNGAHHQAHRRTINRVLTRTSLGELEPVIRAFASALIDDLATRDVFDAIADLGEAVPSFVMAHILGLRQTDTRLLLRCAIDVSRTFDPAPPSLYRRLNGQMKVVLDHLSQRVSEAEEGTGLSLVYESAIADGEARLTEAAATVFFLFMVGTETSSATIGSVLRTLLQRPELYEQARRDPAIVEHVVDEVLRLEGSVQRVARVATQTRVIGGISISTGDRLLLLLGAANRDPAAFAAPHDVDLTRRSDHVAFGGGAHRCPGARLAALEARIAVEEFLRLPMMELAGLEQWYAGRSIRRLTQLPLRRAKAPDVGAGHCL